METVLHLKAGTRGEGDTLVKVSLLSFINEEFAINCRKLEVVTVYQLDFMVHQCWLLRSWYKSSVGVVLHFVYTAAESIQEISSMF